MKNLSGSEVHRNRKHTAIRQTACRLIPMIIMLGYLVTGCQKENSNMSKVEKQELQSIAPSASANILNDVPGTEDIVKNYTGLSWQTRWELEQARAATAKYLEFKNATKDGYEDINVVVPGMGYHYLKSANVDATFDIRKPEILVYNKSEDGIMQLEAVEYAVPIDLTPDKAPEGFTGSSDEWDRNTGFGLWLLHAWVWKFNPDGVFKPMNPLVHLH